MAEIKAKRAELLAPELCYASSADLAERARKMGALLSWIQNELDLMTKACAASRFGMPPIPEEAEIAQLTAAIGAANTMAQARLALLREIATVSADQEKHRLRIHNQLHRIARMAEALGEPEAGAAVLRESVDG